MASWVVFTFWLLRTCVYKFLCRQVFSRLLSKWEQNSWIIWLTLVNHLGTARLLCKAAATFHIPASRVPVSPHPQHIYYLSFWYHHPAGVKWLITVVPPTSGHNLFKSELKLSTNLTFSSSCDHPLVHSSHTDWSPSLTDAVEAPLDCFYHGTLSASDLSASLNPILLRWGLCHLAWETFSDRL